MAYNLQGFGLAGGFGMLNAHRFTDGTNKWNGLSIFCHNATHYWLLKSLLSQEPTLDQYIKVAFKYAENLKLMIRKGTRLKSAAELARLPADTILIYSEDGVHGDHSCVFKSGGIIAGYNQLGWFSSGVSHSYTTHPYTSIVWLPNVKLVKGDSHHPRCHLFAVPEVKAKRVIEKVHNAPE
jgi:hypothetical protein